MKKIYRNTWKYIGRNYLLKKVSITITSRDNVYESDKFKEGRNQFYKRDNFKSKYEPDSQ